MAELWKEICRSGRHTYIDPKTDQPKVLDATPELIRYWHDQGKAMVSAGLSIPVPMEHDEKAKPLTAREKAVQQLTGNAGWVKDFDVRKVKEPDGTEVDAVFGLHDIPDPAIAKKLPSTIKFCSPYFSSFVDGDGKTWNGVITHSALTTRPRIHRQTPFPDMGAALSLASSGSVPFEPAKLPAGQGFSLSRAGLFRKSGDKFKPAFPLAFSLLSGAKLAVEDLKEAEEKEKPKPKGEPPAKKEGGEKPEGKEGLKPPTAEGPEGAEQIAAEVESLVDTDGDISIYDVLADLLECLDDPITLEPGEPENFNERLYKAIMGKRKGDAMPTNPNEKPNQAASPTSPAGPKQEVVAPPMFMSANLSLEQINALADPREKEIALSLHQQRQKVSALEKRVIEDAKRVRQARVDAVKKKMPKDNAEALQALSDGYGFALGDDGVVKDDFDKALAVFEKSVIDVPALLRDPQAKFTIAEQPEGDPGGVSEARRQAIVNEARRSAGQGELYKAG